MARASERPGGLDGSANAILLEAASLSRHPAAPLTPPPPAPSLASRPGPRLRLPRPSSCTAGAPRPPWGGPAVSRTHSAVFSRAIKRQRKMNRRGWKWGEVPLGLRCARGDDLKRFSHLLFRLRAGGMKTPRAAILRISALARGGRFALARGRGSGPHLSPGGGGGCGETNQSSPPGCPVSARCPPGLARARLSRAKRSALYVLGTQAGKSPFNKALLKPFAFRQFAYTNLEISPS